MTCQQFFMPCHHLFVTHAFWRAFSKMLLQNAFTNAFLKRLSLNAFSNCFFFKALPPEKAFLDCFPFIFQNWQKRQDTWIGSCLCMFVYLLIPLISHFQASVAKKIKGIDFFQFDFNFLKVFWEPFSFSSKGSTFLRRPKAFFHQFDELTSWRKMFLAALAIS